MTSIEWTDKTWNPTTGCDRISTGCDNCYALAMARRLKGMGSAKYQTDGDPRTSGPGFGLAPHPDVLTEPLRWRKPRKVFVNSMSDLFHARVPREFLARVFAVMAATPQHTYQILTKRPERAARILNERCKCGHPNGEHFRASMEWAATSHSPTYVPGLEHGIYHRAGWPLPNVWIGTSVENQKYADLRIPALLDTPAVVRFLSCEPLLGPVDLRTKGCPETVWDGPYRMRCSLGGDADTCSRHGQFSRAVPDGLHWVIAGGESGHGARPMSPGWVRSLRDQCTSAGVPFLFKQWGEYQPTDWKVIGRPRDPRNVLVGDQIDDLGHRWEMRRVGKGRAGRLLDGRAWDEYPAPHPAAQSAA